MGLAEWIGNRWHDLREPNEKQWLASMKYTQSLVENRDAEALEAHVAKWRNSTKIIAIILTQMTREDFIRTPSQAADEKVLRLMARLRATRFMQRHGTSLRLPGNSAPDYVHGLLAMHTFLLDAAQKQQPSLYGFWIDPLELRAAENVLDRVYRERTAHELERFIAAGAILPSPYVSLRYGWEKDFGRIEALRRQMDGAGIYGERELQVRLAQLEAPLALQAECRLEELHPEALPESYTDRLDWELNHLGWLLRNPHITDYKGNEFLCKYGIDAEASRDKRMLQIEQAVRHLDRRLVRLTGRRSCVEELLAPLRPKTEQPAPHPERSPTPCRERTPSLEPSFGSRKMKR